MTQTRGGLCGGGSWNFKCTCSGSPQERARDTDSTRVTKKTQLLGALAGSAIVSRPRVLFDSATAFFFRSSRAFATLSVRRPITDGNGNRVPETQRSRFVAGRPGPPSIAPCATTTATTATTARSRCGDGALLSACRVGLFLPSLSRLDGASPAEAARTRQTLAAVVGPRRESGGRGGGGSGGGDGARDEPGDGDGRVVARCGGVQAAGHGGRSRRAQGRRT